MLVIADYIIRKQPLMDALVMEHMTTWRTSDILLWREEFQTGGAVDTHFYFPATMYLGIRPNKAL